MKHNPSCENNQVCSLYQTRYFPRPIKIIKTIYQKQSWQIRFYTYRTNLNNTNLYTRIISQRQGIYNTNAKPAVISVLYVYDLRNAGQAQVETFRK